METLELEGSEYIQLCDLLKTMGMCSTGGEAKNVISQGLVSVNGEIELRKRCKIKAGSVVEFNQESVKVV